MKVQLENALVEIKWHHWNTRRDPEDKKNNPDEKDPSKMKFKTPSIIGTQCILTITNTTNPKEKLSSEGLTKLAHNDQYNREIGRRKTLQRALDNCIEPTSELVIFSKTERATIWQEYRKFGFKDNRLRW